MRFDRSREKRASLPWAAGLAVSSLVVGCASPGPPRPPSLFLPRPANDLRATRSGDLVHLQFSLPALSTDGQPLRAHALEGVLCRQDAPRAPCHPVDAAETAQPLPVPGPGSSRTVLWTDTLPAPLLRGAPRPIAYRVELRKAGGGNAGYSDPVYTAAGQAPPPVADLLAEGNRLGIELRWTPVTGAGEVLLQRLEPQPPGHSQAGPQTAPPPVAPGEVTQAGRNAHGVHTPGPRRQSGVAESQAGLVWLQADPGAQAASATLDNNIEPGVAYRYTAIRRETVQVGGRSLQLESQPSPAVEMTWHDIFPPPAPTELTALGYDVPAAGGHPAGYAVDLVWLPVEDIQLAGYLVNRQALGANGEALGPKVRLTPQPVPTPGFHDASAAPGQRYRYSVFAVAANGQGSPAAETILQPGGMQ